MANAYLNLVVIRVKDIEQAHQFYSALGLTFTKHAHGKGPEHYACEQEGIVFEIYPENNELERTTNIRLGFKVHNIADALARMNEFGGKILAPAKESPWGIRAVIQDPFGYKIELLEHAK